jgi:hypothetical protein
MIKGKKTKSVLVCWHCGETGHEKMACLAFHLDLAMTHLVPHNTSPVIRDIVRKKARITLVAAIEGGKEGGKLRFGGAPWQLNMEWPFTSPAPAFPTRGVWHLGKYYGDDA